MPPARLPESRARAPLEDAIGMAQSTPCLGRRDARRQVLWDTGTSISGPLFFAFVDWSLGEAERRNIDDVYFLSRGGEILLRVAQVIQRHRPRRVRLHYLHVSRLAVAGLGATTDELKELIAPSCAFHSTTQAFANIGLEQDHANIPPWLAPGDRNRNLTRLERLNLVKWLLEASERPRIEQALAARKKRIQEYLSAIGFPSSGSIALIDTGWRGSIQYNLELALADMGKASVTGFYIGVNEKNPLKCYGEMFGYLNSFHMLPLSQEGTICVLLELLAQARHGPVQGYMSVGGDAAVPKLGLTSRAAVQDAELLQEAALAFVEKALADGKVPRNVVVGDLANEVILRFARLYWRPTPAEASVFGRMPYSNQFLERSYSVMCPSLGLRALIRALLRRRGQPPGWWIYGHAQLAWRPLLKAYIFFNRIVGRCAKPEREGRLRAI